MDDETVPITERSNSLTENIDKASPIEIVSQLKKCDEEIFKGWNGINESVKSEAFLQKLKEAAQLAAEILSAKSGAIILSGCGTSGRIAFLISREFNELALQEQLRTCYRYICAGGDKALTTSVETFEDDWQAGRKALVKEARGFRKILFFGITCGLSAPFVGGQVEYCLEHPDRFTPYLLGFNPASQARNVPVKGTHKVLRDIALEMEERGFLMNPVVGPEPITGSTRMKGGTATKMILESIFLPAQEIAAEKSTRVNYSHMINTYKMSLDFTYRKKKHIASLIELGGASLSNSGTVTYLGWGSLGIMSLIDAAECIPTFSADRDDVRGFIKDGYQSLKNKEGDLSGRGNVSEIGFEYFNERRCPHLSEKDTVVFILGTISPNDKQLLREMMHAIKARRCKVAVISITRDEKECDQLKNVLKILGGQVSVHVHLPMPQTAEDCFGSYLSEKFSTQCAAEVSLKCVVNALSTGAHIMKGKVMKNYMIDLKLSNRKLFERAVSIVSLLGKVSSRKATLCLLKSIYRTDMLPGPVVTAEISQHVKNASLVDKVIPLALLLSTDKFNRVSSLKMLEVCPIVRRCIDENI